MATTTFTPSMLRGAGTRGVPEIPAGAVGETKFVMEVTIPSDGYAITLFMNTTGNGTLNGKYGCTIVDRILKVETTSNKVYYIRIY